MLFLLSAPIGAQGVGDGPPDSAAYLYTLRDAQRGFESFRRSRLPWSTSASGRCEERFGRFCYWYDENPGQLPAEPGAIADARARVLGRLADGAFLLPGDDWIAGQRVRYLVEHGDPSAAIGAADACRGSDWWCIALQGFARHAALDFAEAERAFGQALAILPPRERCAWTDLEPWLDGAARDTWRAAGCDSPARDSLATRFWLLAQPRLAAPGNDLRTEFFARKVMAELLRDAATAYQTRFGDDQAELILRYGWSVRFSRSFPTSPLREPDIQGHERRPGYSFLPTVDRDGQVTWDLQPMRPRVRYAPPYARAIRAIDRFQIARFRRGDSTVVIVRWRLAADTLFGGDTRAVLAVSYDPRADPVVTSAPSGAGSSTLVAQVPGDPVLIGVEVRDSVARSLARLRSIPVSQPIGRVSDPLLLEPRETYPENLEEAARLARADFSIPEGGTVGLYWEMYDVPGDGPVRIAITVERMGGSRLAKLGRTIGLSDQEPPFRLAWEDRRTRRAGAEGRSIGLDLARLDKGTYRLLLEVTFPGESTVGRERRLEIGGS